MSSYVPKVSMNGKQPWPHEDLQDELHSTFLLPFLLTSSMYFILRLPEDEPCLTAAFVKCLPMFYLIWFVWLRGVSNHAYNWCIFMGLIASCVGDFVLIWGQDNVPGFLGGTAAFSIAHIFYMAAYGLTPIGWKFLAYFTGSICLGAYIVLPNVPNVLFYPLFMYSVFCNSMAWRAMVHLTSDKDTGVTWRKKVFTAVGAMLFTVSDFSLGYNMFVSHMFYQKELIMITYYLAQLLKALSTENLRVSLLSSELDSLHVQ